MSGLLGVYNTKTGVAEIADGVSGKKSGCRWKLEFVSVGQDVIGI